MPRLPYRGHAPLASAPCLKLFCGSAFARIWSAVLVHVKGWERVFQPSMKAWIVVVRSRREVKVPRWMACFSMTPRSGPGLRCSGSRSGQQLQPYAQSPVGVCGTPVPADEQPVVLDGRGRDERAVDRSTGVRQLAERRQQRRGRLTAQVAGGSWSTAPGAPRPG